MANTVQTLESIATSNHQPGNFTVNNHHGISIANIVIVMEHTAILNKTFVNFFTF